MALVTSSTILATLVQSSRPPKSRTTTTTHVRLVTPGTLFVNELPVFPSDPEPSSGRSFTIVGGSGPVTPDTNDSDNFAVVLQPGEYVLQVSDPRFHLKIPFEIFLGNVTIVTVLVVKHAAFPYFAEISDADSSGWITNSSSFLTAFFLPSSSVHENDLAFIEVLRNSGYSGIESYATGRAVVTSVDPRGETTFVQLQALREFRTSGLAGSLVVIYDPTYTVKVSSAS